MNKFENLYLSKVVEVDLGEELAINKIGITEGYEILNPVAKKIYLAIKNKENYDDFINNLLNIYVGVNKEELENDIELFIKALKKDGIVLSENEEEISIKEVSGKTENTAEKKVKYNDNYLKIYNYYLKRNKPFKVFLELTYNCNLKCKHCYLGENSFDTNYNNKEKLKEIIDQMKEEGVVELNVTGGEACIYPDLLEILEYAVDKGFLVTLLTNATLLDENKLDKLKKLKLNDVRISIYGLEGYHDDFVRLKGAFKRSINALTEIRKSMGVGTAVCVITKENYKKVDELKEYLEKYKIPLQTNPLIFPELTGNKHPLNLRLSPDEMKEFIVDNDVDTGSGICTAGIARFRITPSLEVNPCEMLRNINLGNLKEKSFKEIIESQERKEWIDTFNKVMNERQCNKCENKKYCSNCIGRANLETGNIYGYSNYHCEISKFQNVYFNNKMKEE